MGGIDPAVVGAFALLWAVAVPTPGANQLMVTHLALTRTRRDVAAAIAGNLLGTATWAFAAQLGLVVILAAFPAAHLAILFAGGSYLIWFGVRLLRASFRADGAAPELSGRPFVLGLATALSNAQAVFFITSIFAVAGVVGANFMTGLAVVTVLMLMNGAYLWGLASLLMRPAPRAAYGRWRPWLQRVFGGLFILFGGRLLWRALRP